MALRRRTILLHATGLALADLVLVAVRAFLEPRLEDSIRESMFQLGRWAGCSYFQSGVYAVGVNGPFFGDDFRTNVCNALWRHAPWLTPTLIAFLAALAVWLAFHALAARLLARHDGVTRCGTCAYALSGLREPRCPECGTRI